MSKETKVTAVDWLVQHLTEYGFDLSLHKFEIYQAQAIHEQQMKDAALSSVTTNHKLRKIFENQFEQYYTETYGK
jgi:hypothetical protein